mgnify:CR=1 FL=1
MALFKRGARGADPAPVRVDVTFGDSRAKRARLAARSNDGDTLHALIAETDDPHEREFLLYASLDESTTAEWQRIAECFRPVRVENDAVAAGLQSGKATLHEVHAAGHGRERDDRWDEPGETLGVFQPDRPNDFEKTGDEQDAPGHDDPPFKAGSSPREMIDEKEGRPSQPAIWGWPGGPAITK